MITILLYTRPGEDTHALRELLDELQQEVPHRLVEVDIEASAGLKEKLSGRTPALKIGPYLLTGDFERTRVLITLRAAAQGKAQGRPTAEPYRATRTDRALYWFSRHWLLVFNLLVGLYFILPFLAPTFMKAGLKTPAKVIYTAYGFTCHQLAFRSWFLYGLQPAYPRAAAHVEGWMTYGEATGLDEDDLWQARRFIGNPTLGYKVAMCERDVAIYGAFLIFGLLFGLTRRRIPPLPWYLWLLLGWLPIGLDGLSQILSQVPHSFIPYRESTPLLRTFTGFMFGFTTAWFGYPLIEASMKDNLKALEARFHISRSVWGE